MQNLRETRGREAHLFFRLLERNFIALSPHFHAEGVAFECQADADRFVDLTLVITRYAQRFARDTGGAVCCAQREVGLRGGDSSILALCSERAAGGFGGLTGCE